MKACTCAPLHTAYSGELRKRVAEAMPDGRLVNVACPLHSGHREPTPPRELPEYTDTHDGQTEPSVWPPLDEEGFPF